MTTTQCRTGMLLALAALGATGMFLGPDGWFGIDIGPTGAALLYLVLVILLIHVARHGEAAFPESTSLAERQAWVSGFAMRWNSTYAIRASFTRPQVLPAA